MSDNEKKEKNEVESQKANVLNSSNLPEKSSLSNASIPDSRLLSELDANAQPIKPLPDDTLVDVYYKQIMEPRCVLCKSPFRTRAEHIYLERGRRSNAVVNFFLEYLNARISWDCVEGHMKRHCDFSRIITPGLRKLENRQDNNERYKYKELELAITLVTNEIDELYSLEVNNVDLRLKLSQQLDRLSKNLVDLTKMRDERIAAGNISILSVLKDIWDEIGDCTNCKMIIANKVREIQSVLSDR